MVAFGIDDDIFDPLDEGEGGGGHCVRCGEGCYGGSKSDEGYEGKSVVDHDDHRLRSKQKVLLCGGLC